MRPRRLTLASGRTAEALPVGSETDLRRAPEALGVERDRPVLVLVGGAAGLDEGELERLAPMFTNVLAPLAEKLGACVVDGGTDAGVMRLMGRARSRTQARFPLVGVLVADLVTMPGERAKGDAPPLEPNHTHFVLVPGSAWGDEGPWLARVASAIAGQAGSITILVDGGEISWRDAACSVEARRPVVVAEGSGRTADVLAAALRRTTGDARARSLVASGLVQAVELGDGAALARLIEDELGRG